MNLGLAQVLLEEARFSHVGNFLAAEQTPLAAPHRVQMEVQIVRGAETNRAGVRLRVSTLPEDAQYSMLVSYLALFTYEPDQDEEFYRRLALSGAMMLFPFAREVVGNLTQRARFGAMWLQPANFTESLAGEPPKKPLRKRNKRRAK